MPAPVAQAFISLGFPTSTAFGIGLVELALIVIYAIPLIIAAVIWAGVSLRDARVRAIWAARS